MRLKIIFLRDLARFVQKLHFLQETQLLLNFCIESGKWCKIVARILQYVFFIRILQKLY